MERPRRPAPVAGGLGLDLTLCPEGLRRIGPAIRGPPDYWESKLADGRDSGGGGIRTHVGLLLPVFKLGEGFCVRLRLAAFSCGLAGFGADSVHPFCVWLRLVSTGRW